MKKQVFYDLKVVLKRGPLVDRTNRLEMPRSNADNKKISQKQDIKITIVPYSKSSHLNNNENAQAKGIVKRSGDISGEGNAVPTKRIRNRKVPSRCPCCTNQSSAGSKNASSRNISSKKSVDRIENANKQVKSNTCHDKQFKLQCRVILERVNIEELSKKSIKPNNDKKTLDNQISVSKPSCKDHDKIIEKGHVVSKILQPKINLNQRKVSSSVPAKSLRQQIQPNYAEITINTSTEEMLPDTRQICATKVPVYKQHLDNEKTKKPDNLYEFDESDSDRSREQKNGKRLKKSRKLDGSLYTVPQKYNVKKTRARVNRKRAKIHGSARKYEQIMHEVVQKVMEKVSHEPKGVENKVKEVAWALPKQTVSSDSVTTRAPKTVSSQNGVTVRQVRECLDKIGSVTPSTLEVLKDISPGNIITSSKANTSETQTRHVIDKVVFNEAEIRIGEHGNQNVIESVPQTNKENIPPEQNIRPGSLHASKYIINESFSDDSRASLSKEADMENVPPGHDLPLSEHIIDESFNDDNDNGNIYELEGLDDSFLNFDIVHSTPVKDTARINIISDVLIHKAGVKKKPKQNPWRFNQAVTRNPHFIILKTTALPCLKQDMVLDHNQVEKIEENFSKTPRKVETPQKSPVQKSILDYMDSHERRNPENVPPRASLFDYDDFSPIKSKSPHRKALKDKATRNILGVIQDNAANIVPFTSTPVKRATVRPPFIRYDENDDIANCFGFEDDTVSKDKDRASEAKPFRIKEYVGKQPKPIVASVDVVEEDLSVGEPIESQIVGSGAEGHIFDDPEQAFSLTVPSKIYIRKPRKKRLKSVEMDNEVEHHPKKRKKDMMTKAEEAALEDWAEKFNSMCKEVEKYHLEIE